MPFVLNAAYAVDELSVTSFSCTKAEVGPWWSVNLDGKFRVHTIRVFNRWDAGGDQLSQTIIETQSGNSQGPWRQCASLDEPTVEGGVYEVNCKGVLASAVRLRSKRTTASILTLVEVEVYGDTA